jgi:hypothetical protein
MSRKKLIPRKRLTNPSFDGWASLTPSLEKRRG